VEVDGVVSLFGFANAPPAGLIATTVDGIPSFLPRQAGDRVRRPRASVGRPRRHWRLGAIESWAGPRMPLAWSDVTRLQCRARRF
jgi:hypothetical protein